MVVVEFFEYGVEVGSHVDRPADSPESCAEQDDSDRHHDEACDHCGEQPSVVVGDREHIGELRDADCADSGGSDRGEALGGGFRACPDLVGRLGEPGGLFYGQVGR